MHKIFQMLYSFVGDEKLVMKGVPVMENGGGGKSDLYVAQAAQQQYSCYVRCFITVVGSKSGGKCVTILLAVLIDIICVSVAIMEWYAAFQNWICEMYDVPTPDTHHFYLQLFLFKIPYNIEEMNLNRIPILIIHERRFFFLNVVKTKLQQRVEKYRIKLMKA